MAADRSAENRQPRREPAPVPQKPLRRTTYPPVQRHHLPVRICHRAVNVYDNLILQFARAAMSIGTPIQRQPAMPVRRSVNAQVTRSCRKREKRKKRATKGRLQMQHRLPRGERERVCTNAGRYRVPEAGLIFGVRRRRRTPCCIHRRSTDDHGSTCR